MLTIGGNVVSLGGGDLDASFDSPTFGSYLFGSVKPVCRRSGDKICY